MNIIFFDGECNLCNFYVQFILKHDKKNLFQFASLQSEFGRDFSKKHKLHTPEFDTVIYMKDNEIFIHSNAVLQIAKILGGWFYPIYFLRFIPENVRNKTYNYLAKNRIKWFGKSESCALAKDRLIK